ncbi:MAG: PrsW family intramembrane metalloprotease [Sphaerochaetaceae bacterium]|nr:PrsW family intramembrane metalloprotease [Sphaerochaetaceae bacterium]
MFYFMLYPFMVYSKIMVLAAIIPAVILMVYVYKSDRLEKESPRFLGSLIVSGILSALVALVLEWVLSAILDSVTGISETAYNVILYFIIVAGSEECSKYFFLRRKTWKSREFNCMYDGVVYAVFVSLGFALWENISYVMRWGLSVALLRAVTAIPGHACFGVFMGVFYGQARGYAFMREVNKKKVMNVLSVLAPVVLHGAYDYIASSTAENSSWYFIIFVAAMFIVSLIMVKNMSKNDRYFRLNRSTIDYEIL